MAKLIVLEGADKVGKYTQSTMLVDAIRLDDQGAFVTRVEPAKEAHPWMRRLIYWMLDTGRAKRYPNTFQFVQFLNKAYFQAFKLPRLLADNDYVIMDRWSLSGYVYGKAEGISSWLNAWMYRHIRRADLTLVLAGTSYKRSEGADDSYERDTELQCKAKELYAEAGRYWPAHRLVYNCGSPDEINGTIMNTLKSAGILPGGECSPWHGPNVGT